MERVLGKGTKLTKNFFLKITNVLDQMIRSTSILHINLFLKKNKIWSLFPALTLFIIIKLELEIILYLSLKNLIISHKELNILLIMHQLLNLKMTFTNTGVGFEVLIQKLELLQHVFLEFVLMLLQLNDCGVVWVFSIQKLEIG